MPPLLWHDHGNTESHTLIRTSSSRSQQNHHTNNHFALHLISISFVYHIFLLLLFSYLFFFFSQTKMFALKIIVEIVMFKAYVMWFDSLGRETKLVCNVSVCMEIGLNSWNIYMLHIRITGPSSNFPSKSLREITAWHYKCEIIDYIHAQSQNEIALPTYLWFIWFLRLCSYFALWTT